MAVDLGRPAADVEAAEYRTMLDNIQGNILKSHGRNVERHVFLKFTGAAGDVRRWIRERIAPRVLTAAAQYEQARRRRADENFDGGMVTLFHLSAAGYSYLGLNPSRLDSSAFRKGMKDQRDNVIEDFFSTGNKDPKPHRWEQGYRGAIHAMVQLGTMRRTRPGCSTSSSSSSRG